MDFFFTNLQNHIKKKFIITFFKNLQTLSILSDVSDKYRTKPLYLLLFIFLNKKLSVKFLEKN